MTDTTTQIWSDFSDAVWRFIRSRVASDADADDVLQEVFLKVHDRRTQLRDSERVAGWVFRIASNAVTDHHRRNAKHEHPPPELEPKPARPKPVAVDSEQLLVQCIRPFVAQLPAHYQEAIELTELQGMTQAEAAEHVGMSVSGMKSRVQRGRGKLRQALEQCCEITLDARNRVLDAEPRCGPGCGTENTESVRNR